MLVITLRKSYQFIIAMILLCTYFTHFIWHPCSDKLKVQLPEPFSIYQNLFYHCFTPSVLFNISCPSISVMFPISKSHKSLTTTFTGVMIRTTYLFSYLSDWCSCEFANILISVWITRKTRAPVGWACVAHLSFCFEDTLCRTFHRCFLPNFCSFGYTVSEENIV